MSDHECRGECQCKKVVIPVIFVPDFLGTRLYNVQAGEVVWDPMAGMGSYHTPLGTAAIDLSGMITKQTAMANASPLVKKLLALQEKLTKLHGALMALYQMSQKIAKALGLNSLSKRLEGASTDAVDDSKEATSKLKAQLAEIKTKIAHIEKKLPMYSRLWGKLKIYYVLGVTYGEPFRYWNGCFAMRASGAKCWWGRRLGVMIACLKSAKMQPKAAQIPSISAP